MNEIGKLFWRIVALVSPERYARYIGVKIGDNARIGAGCVVVDDVPANATVVMPKPRVIIRQPSENKS